MKKLMGWCFGIVLLFTVTAPHVSALEPYEVVNSAPYDRPPMVKVTGKATGFFHVQEIDGVWWIIDPRGNGFYITGVNQFMPGGMDSTRAERDAAIAEAGGAKAWNRIAMGQLNQWGLNVVTLPNEPYFWVPFTGEDLAKRGIVYARHISFGYDFWRSAPSQEEREAHCMLWTGKWNSASDPFHPDWMQWCRDYARKHVAPHKDDQWLLGWFIDNERATNDGDYVLRIVSAYDPSRPCKQALVKLAQQRFKTVDRFNAAFQTDYKDFTALLNDRSTGLTQPTPGARAFGEAYVAAAAEAYYSAIYNAIREVDPNHMILGGRDSSAQYVDPWIEVAGKYVDVYSLHTYRPVNLDEGMEARLVKHYRQVHDVVKRPMFLTEWSYPVPQEGKPNLGASGMMVLDHAEQARCYMEFQEGLARLPFMVGSLWFCWGNPVDHRGEFTAYGLVQRDGTPNGPMVRAVAKVNRAVPELHRKSGGDRFTGYVGRFDDWDPDLPKVKPTEVTGLTGDGVSLHIDDEGRLVFSADGQELARIAAQAEQLIPAMRWPAADQVRIVGVGEDERFRVAQCVATFDQQVPDYMPFRAGLRIILPKRGTPFAVIQLLWVENIASRNWVLNRVLIRASPVLAPDAQLINRVVERSRWLGWEHPDLPTGLGYANQSPVVEMAHWRQGGRIVADVGSKVGRPLAPGEKINFNNVWLTLFPYPSGSAEAIIKTTRKVDEAVP